MRAASPFPSQRAFDLREAPGDDCPGNLPGEARFVCDYCGEEIADLPCRSASAARELARAIFCVSCGADGAQTRFDSYRVDGQTYPEGELA
jgi:hypothetical protein